jgi:hypothetical protein
LFLVSLVGLTFIAALAAAVMAGARRHVFVPAIGLPEAWAWVLALPWMLLALTAIGRGPGRPLASNGTFPGRSGLDRGDRGRSADRGVGRELARVTLGP